MTDVADRDRVRNLALQGIGRNVVAFQKMEAMLKFLIANHKIEGLPEQLIEICERNRREVDRQTMGSLVDKFFRSVVVGESRETTDADTQYGTTSVTFSIELDAEAHDETREAFRQIVQERNTLIHQMMVSFDPNSFESCEELSKALDAQRGRLKPQFEKLRSMVGAISKGHKELRDFIESEDFLNFLNGVDVR